MAQLICRFNSLLVCIGWCLYVAIYATDPNSRVPTAFSKTQYILFPGLFLLHSYCFSPLFHSAVLFRPNLLNMLSRLAHNSCSITFRRIVGVESQTRPKVKEV